MIAAVIAAAKIAGRCSWLASKLLLMLMNKVAPLENQMMHQSIPSPVEAGKSAALLQGRWLMCGLVLGYRCPCFCCIDRAALRVAVLRPSCLQVSAQRHVLHSRQDFERVIRAAMRERVTTPTARNADSSRWAASVCRLCSAGFHCCT